MIAFSTLWNADRHEDGMTLTAEVKQLGFNALEVNYKITEPMLTDIAALVERGEIKVTSLHNFTPLPANFTKSPGSGGLFLLSSADEERQMEAVEQTKRTIDYGARLEQDLSFSILEEPKTTAVSRKNWNVSKKCRSNLKRDPEIRLS